MLGFKRVVIAPHERGLYMLDRALESVLEPGVYWIRSLFGRKRVNVVDCTEPEFVYEHLDALLATRADLVEHYFDLIETGEYEVGLVYKHGVLSGVLPPGTRRLYWRAPSEVKVERVSVDADFELPHDQANLLGRLRGAISVREFTTYLTFAEVNDKHVGLLIVDGELNKILKPGLHGFWKFNRNIKIEHVDLRVQAMEVQGQEILTKDKVSLRVNLAAQYQVTDPVKARGELADFGDYLYRELQFALRQAVGDRTLDALLGNKGELDRAMYAIVVDKLGVYGIDVLSVGVKDVILPGDMKSILNQVVETEKAAQANVIKRREETAATRSLLNTARLMDDNPTLLRLKELEVLEKITEKVDKLTVFGGLEGVLKDTVRIGVDSR